MKHIFFIIIFLFFIEPAAKFLDGFYFRQMQGLVFKN